MTATQPPISNPNSPLATFPHGYALLIGVGTCRYAPWSLPVTVADVQAVAGILADPALCAYADDHVRLLHDDGATASAILDGLAWLAERCAADPAATAVVVFSGHGWVDEATNRYYLIPHDVTPFEMPESALAADDFIVALRDVRAERLLVCIDSCHAQGMATAKDAAKELTPVRIPKGFAHAAPPKGVVADLKQGAGRAVILSSLGSQSSYYWADGSSSIFTHHLIEALQGAGSRPGDTAVHVSHLMAHLGRTVPATAQAMGREQTPFFDLASEDFPIALLAGGKGISKGVDPTSSATDRPAYTATNTGDGAIAQGRGSVAAGKGGIAVGGDVHGGITIGGGKSDDDK